MPLRSPLSSRDQIYISLLFNRSGEHMVGKRLWETSSRQGQCVMHLYRQNWQSWISTRHDLCHSRRWRTVKLSPPSIITSCSFQVPSFKWHLHKWLTAPPIILIISQVGLQVDNPKTAEILRSKIGAMPVWAACRAPQVRYDLKFKSWLPTSSLIHCASSLPMFWIIWNFSR